MNDYNKIAYCGLFCGACKTYLCTINNKLKELSEETKIPTELLYCEGCRSDNTSLYCRNCAMKKCCIKKGIFSCNECKEFPCSVLNAFESDKHPHHKGVIRSLLELNEIGKDKWIEHQKDRWNCNYCNEPYSWYENRCKKCGNNIDGL